MSGLMAPAEWLINWFRGGENGSTRVTPYTAVTLPPVWYAFNKICGHIGQMPLDCLVRLNPRGSEQAVRHPAYSLLRFKPNGYQSPVVFKEQIQAHALGWGNGRAYILRGSRPELIPLMPDRTLTLMVDGEKWHVTKPCEHDRLLGFKEPGEDVEALAEAMLSEPNKTIALHDDDVIHVIGFGFNGYCGMSLAEYAQQALSKQLKAQKFQDKQLEKNFAGQLMLKAPVGSFRKEGEAEKFLQQFRKQHASKDDAELVGMLREGVEAQVLNMSNKDAELVEQLKLSRQDVAFLFGLESFPGDDRSVSYNSLEQKNLAYLTNCLNRWLVKWEQECRKLLTEAERRADTHFFKFNTRALLRSDLSTTMNTLGNAIVHRILSANEARDLLDMNPYDGGDVYENPAIAIPERMDDDSEDREERAQALTDERVKIIAGTNQKNFLDWLDKFYTWWTGRDESVSVRNTIDQRQAAIVEASGSVTNADQLRAAINTLYQGWIDNA